MATAPVSSRLNLTRDQLAQFLTDQQQFRQFELLFSTVDTLQVIVGTDFEFQADTAAATANAQPQPLITSSLDQEAGMTRGKTWWHAAFAATTKKVTGHSARWAGVWILLQGCRLEMSGWFGVRRDLSPSGMSTWHLPVPLSPLS